MKNTMERIKSKSDDTEKNKQKVRIVEIIQLKDQKEKKNLKKGQHKRPQGQPIGNPEGEEREKAMKNLY